MAKTHSLGVRLQPDVKAALERAAKQDVRSVSSLVEKIVVEWLRANGHLASGQPSDLREPDASR